MKNSVIKFMMISLLLLASQLAGAQERGRITISVLDKRLETALMEINKVSDYEVQYFKKDVEKIATRESKYSNLTVNELLTELLKGSDLEFTVKGKSIVVKLKARQIVKIDVKGVVKDNAGTPVIGASVVQKGTSKYSITDVDGNFAIKDIPSDAQLEISFLGYQTSLVNVNGRKVIDAILTEDTQLLEEVVITGFQNINKSNFTGSSVKIKSDDLQIKGTPDLSRMLEGSVAGVSIQNVSGTFGSAPKVRVRGATSINGENKPLWVIDGVVQEDVVNISNDELTSGDPATLLGSAVAGLNANDIENINILKDASATALYGARAMNGVIVVTTKKGREGRPIISYSGNYTVQLKPNYSNYDIMNSLDQMSVYAELERKGYLTTNIVNWSNSGVYGKMYNRINTWDDQNQRFLLENTPEARRAFLSRYAMANTDWFDVLLEIH